jgi:hypothetical protein
MTKPFSTEISKPSEPVVTKPPVTKQDVSESESEDRRKLREKKHFSHGHDVSKRGTKEYHAPVEADFAEEKVAAPSPPRGVTPPPLIRELESPRESEQESTQPIVKPDVEETREPASDEMQTSLFGRAPHRKGYRPKSDEPPKPVDEAESFSTKEQEFGRSTRRKKGT